MFDNDGSNQSPQHRRFTDHVKGPVQWISFLVLSALAVNINAAVSGPIQIGSRLELFLDDALLESKSQISVKLHPPRIAETVLRFDVDWEGPGNHYITVFYDPPLYRMYYRCVPGKDLPAKGSSTAMRVCYAESRDGIRWERPRLALFDFRGSKENNIVLASQSTAPWPETGNFAPFKDMNPEAPAAERYKAVGGKTDGLFAFVSPDGIHWKQKGTAPIMTKNMTPEPMRNAFDSQNCPFWDSVKHEYVAYIRDSYLSPETGESTRGIRRSSSPDFLHWSTPKWIDVGGPPDENLYTNAITPYFCAPHLYLGFPMRYMPHRDATLSGVDGVVRGTGISDSIFMASRDGVHWHRFLESFVRPGLDPWNWTDRSNCVARGVVPTGTNEISLYILRHYRLPSIQLVRGVLRTDGFVSLKAPHTGGEVITKRIIFAGSQLVVNCATSAAGSLRVEIQDQNGAPIEGYRMADSEIFFGDSIDHRIRWKGTSDVSNLGGRAVRLRFMMDDADLYSVQFRK